MSNLNTFQKLKTAKVSLTNAPSCVLQRKCACGNHTVAGGECETCRKEKPSVKSQRAATNAELINEVPPIVHDVLRSSGQPLDTATRAFMEPRFGHDFSGVRVHTDLRAADSAMAVSANAYTVDNHIAFGGGKYQPQNGEGKRLLAHELAHVVQQRRGGIPPRSLFQDSVLERDADQAASTIAQGSRIVEVAGSSGIRVARQPSQVPPNLSFLTPKDIQKLQAFGTADFQQSINALQANLSKTKDLTATGRPRQFIESRQSAGEIRTFLDYIRDPEINAIKVVPSSSGGRSPDFYVRDQSGVERRVEVYNITLASKGVRAELRTDDQGQQTRKSPKAQGSVVLTTTEFDETSIRDDIRSKINAGPKGPSQFDAQNKNTQVAGRNMAVGGDVVIQIDGRGSVSKTRLDGIIKSLEPELVASSANRVVISATNTDDPRAGRTVFEYNRQGQTFTGTERRPHYAPTVVAPQVGGNSSAKNVSPITTTTAPTPKAEEGSATTVGKAAAPASKVMPGTTTTQTLSTKSPTVKTPATLAQELETETLGVSPKLPAGSASKSASLSSKSPLLQGLKLNAAALAATALLGYADAKIKQWIAESEIESEVEAKLKALQPQFEALMAQSPDKIFANVNATILTITHDVITDHGVDEKSGFPIVFVTVTLDTKGIASSETSGYKYLGMAEEHSTNLNYALLLIDLVKEQARLEEEAKKKQRAREQQILAERLRQAAQKREKEVQPDTAQRQPQTPLIPTLGTAPQEKPLSFLPGAPGRDPIKEAAEWTKRAEAYGGQLVTEGMSLLNRTLSNNSPTQKERQDFYDKKNQWRDAVMYGRNWFKDQSREEAAIEISRILEQKGNKLNEISTSLGEVNSKNP